MKQQHVTLGPVAKADRPHAMCRNRPCSVGLEGRETLFCASCWAAGSWGGGLMFVLGALVEWLL